MNTTKQKVLAFLNQFDDCVLATNNEFGKPEAATVGFSENQNCELMIGTTSISRKCQNIFKNPNVAIVVGFEGDITVQFEGVARILEGDELLARKKLHFQKVPEARVFESDPSQVYFSVTPNWVRYTDFTKNPVAEEIREFI